MAILAEGTVISLPVKDFSWRWEEGGSREQELLSFPPGFSVNLKHASLSLCLKPNLLKILFLPFLPPPLQIVWLVGRQTSLESSNHSFNQLTVCF